MPQQLEHRLAANSGGQFAVPVTAAILDRGKHRAQRGQPRSQAWISGQGASAQPLQQRLGQRPVRHAAAAGHSSAAENDRADGERFGGQRRGQAGLTDPCLTSDEDHAPASRFGSRERGPQHLELGGTADQHGTQQLRHLAIIRLDPAPQQVMPR